MKHVCPLFLVLTVIFYHLSIISSQDPYQQSHKRSVFDEEEEESQSSTKRQRTSSTAIPTTIPSFSLLSETSSSSSVTKQSTQKERATLLHAIKNDDIETVVNHLNTYPQDIDLKIKVHLYGIKKRKLKMKNYIEIEEDQDTEEIDEETLLIRAVKSESLHVFGRLLKLTPAEKIDATAIDGKTALAHAVEIKSIPMAKALLKRGAQVNIPDEISGSTLLMDAIYNFDPKMVALLIKNGAHINQVNSKNDNTPLLYFMYLLAPHYVGQGYILNRDQKKVLQLLIKNGANLEDKNKDGETPLAMAVRAVSYDMVNMLLQAGANIDTTNAAHKRPIDIAKQELSVLDTKQYTPEKLAILNAAYTKIILLLQEYDLKRQHIVRQSFAEQYGQTGYPKDLTNIMDEYLTSSTVDMPDELSRNLAIGSKESIEYLQNNAKYLHSRDKHGNTPLMIASQYAHNAIVETLLDMSADKDVCNYAGKTALDLVKENLAIAVEPAKRKRLEDIQNMLTSAMQ